MIMLEDIQHTKITLLKRCRDREIKEITLNDALKHIKTSEGTKAKIDKIRASTPEQRKHLKVETLEAFVVSGIFNGEVKNDAFLQSSGLMCIDIDHIGDVEASKRIISKIESVVACFASPSGDGLKVLLRINPVNITGNDSFRALFPYVRELFLNNGGFRLDEARKDIAGLCFTSYDSDIYINYEALVFDPVIVPAARYEPVINQSDSNTSQACIKTVVNMLIAAGVGERHTTRLAAARTAGGYIAGGLVDEGEMRAALQRASDYLSSTGITDPGEQQTLEDGLKLGATKPLLNVWAKIDESPSQEQLLNFELIQIKTIIDNPVNIKWMIKGVLECGGVSLISGAYGSGKSFVAFDMAFCIATGLEWHGSKVLSAPVIVLAGEGHSGIGDRFEALTLHYDTPCPDNLYLSKKPARITDRTNAVWVKQAVEAVCPDAGLIIIDTLNRNFGDGDENSSKDMSVFVTSLDDNFRHSGKTVLVVHHTGHVADKRARGSSVLPASCEGEFIISKNKADDGLLLECMKQKNARRPDDMLFNFKYIGLNRIDDEGDEISSLVLEFTGIAEKEKKILTLNDNDIFIIETYRDYEEDGKISYQILRELCLDNMKTKNGTHEQKKSAFHNSKKKLISEGYIFVYDDAV